MKFENRFNYFEDILKIRIDSLKNELGNQHTKFMRKIDAIEKKLILKQNELVNFEFKILNSEKNNVGEFIGIETSVDRDLKKYSINDYTKTVDEKLFLEYLIYFFKLKFS